ncbi:MAG: PAS domain-containing protein [Verrucomicrobiota bacterium]
MNRGVVTFLLFALANFWHGERVMSKLRRLGFGRRLAMAVIAGNCFWPFAATDTSAADSNAIEALDFEVQLETVFEHDDGKFLWYHPRVTPLLPANGATPSVLLTLQKHLHVSDYYSGLHVMRRKTVATPWAGPDAVPELDWRKEPDGVTLSVADVTPGWHGRTGKVLAIGCQVPYSPKGEQLDEKPRQHQTAYAVFDPAQDSWSKWEILDMPRDRKFDFSRNACAQWLVRHDGHLLVPVYFGPNAKEPFSVTVVLCRFDGRKLGYLEHGDELKLAVQRGLVEPSIVAFGTRYFLTLRNDERGYVTSSDDGLRWAPMRPWTFDDGAELGSYNTQQHWLAHSEGLFLVYTRRGANNDHIMRHRAPLFIAQVNPATLQVIRRTEKILVPERGGELGNFGAATINRAESWVTVSEGVWTADARRRGATGATFVARVLWSKPNRLAEFP